MKSPIGDKMKIETEEIDTILITDAYDEIVISLLSGKEIKLPIDTDSEDTWGDRSGEQFKIKRQD